MIKAAAAADVEKQRIQRIEAFRVQNHSLRISASNVAAVSGFHPWKNLPDLFLHDLVYQGSIGRELLRSDAALLGLTLVSSDDSLLGLANKAGEATREIVREALKVKKGEKVLPDVQAAVALKDKAATAASKILTARELELLLDGVRDAVNTGYGSVHEDNALDLYEQQIGWPVVDRNSEVRVWDFGFVHHTGENDSSCLQATVAPLRSAYARLERDASSERKTDSSVSINGRQVEKDPYPFFSIVGSVDGVREELAPALKVSNEECGESVADHDDAETWIIRKVIVECKHRMHRIQVTPPHYEQIQAVTYCFMYDVEDADIVQVLRTSDSRDDHATTKRPTKRPKTRHPDDTENHPSVNKMKDGGDMAISCAVRSPKGKVDVAKVDERETKEDDQSSVLTSSIVPRSVEPLPRICEECSGTSEATASEIAHGSADINSSKVTIAINRISVDDPVLQHREQWTLCVLPRLQSFCEAVYRVRRDDDKRYRLLWAVSAASAPMNDGGSENECVRLPWQLLFEECPWLRHCDTAFTNMR